MEITYKTLAIYNIVAWSIILIMYSYLLIRSLIKERNKE